MQISYTSGRFLKQISLKQYVKIGITFLKFTFLKEKICHLIKIKYYSVAIHMVKIR